MTKPYDHDVENRAVKMGVMKTVRAGIIGLGVGEKHIDGYRSHGSCEVVALCDFSDEKLIKCGEKYPGMKLTKNADEILHDPKIDVVSIASYDNFHYDQITSAIDNEKHVFVEKPMCLYEKEAIEIRKKLNKKPHLKLSSNLILRLAPRFIRLKEMSDRGELGDIYYLECDYNYGRIHKITDGWRGDLEYYSAVHGAAIHAVDLICWITGDTVKEVFAYGNDLSTRGTKFRYNDFVVSILKFNSGRIGKVTANLGCMHPHFHTLTIYGTKATFINGFEEGQLIKSRDPKDNPIKISEDYPGVQKGDLIADFVDSVLNDTKPVIDVDEVFNTMSICFAIEKSIKESRPKEVSYI